MRCNAIESGMGWQRHEMGVGRSPRRGGTRAKTVWSQRREVLGKGCRQREQPVLRVPDRREGAWHTPEEQEVRAAGTEGQGPSPQGSVGLGRSWDSVTCTKAGVGGRLKTRCAGNTCQTPNTILFITV